MSKTKSVVLTTILTIVIVVLCLMCVVPEFTLPFRVGGVWTQYNSVVSVINYGSDLGGGYSAIYYPEGVISAEAYLGQVEYYEDNLRVEIKEYLKADDNDTRTLEELKEAYANTDQQSKDVNQALYEMDEFVKLYAAYDSATFPALADADIDQAAVYMEINEACFKNRDADTYYVGEDFKEEFEEAVELMVKRFDRKNFSSLNISIKDGCTIQVSVPYTVSDPDTLFLQMGYTGEVSLRANAEITTKPLLKASVEHEISDYIKNVDSVTSGSNGIVEFELTTLGREEVYEITNYLKDDETDASLYFYVGEIEVIGLGLANEKDGVDVSSLYVSGNLTPESAETISIVFNSCIKDGVIDTTFSVSLTMDYTLTAGAGTVNIIYIVFAVAMLAAFIFFIVRYKGLGGAHVYAFLSYIICMLMFVAFLPGMLVNASTLFAIALPAVLMSCTNLYIFENIRKEFNTGKTLSSAIKAGYKRSLAPVLDTHILLFVIAFILFYISVSDLIVFSYVFLLGILMSGVSTLLLTRYYAYVMRGIFARPKQHTFYGFKREVIEDEE